MRTPAPPFLLLLLLVGLWAGVACATFSSAWKVERLNEMQASQGPVLTFDSKNFDKLMDGPRNFSTILVFTALSGSQNCQSCRTLDPEFTAAAGSWAALKHPGRLYFAKIDYTSGSEIFARFKLNTAPVVLHFPPNEGDLAKPENKKNPSKYDKYDLTSNGDTAEDLLKYAETIVQTSIPVSKPPDYFKFVLAVTTLLMGAVILKLLSTSFGHYLKRPLFWAFGAFLFTLVMISGNMWNLIRGAPYTGRDEIISNNFSSQYVLETRIVACLYGGGAMALLGLAAHVPNIKSLSLRRSMAYLYCGMFFLCASLVFFVFRFKNGAYPFRLLL